MGDPGFGLYVHWPFCQAKCPYCDFNSHVVASIDHDEWTQGYLTSLDAYAQEVGGRRLDSIFFGGGTPSLMAPTTVEAIIARAQQHWRFTNDIEITLEANPTSVEASRFAGFRAAGVNRVSVGVQALNDADLKRLGRLHSADEARAALDVATREFQRTSFDMIYARPDQSLSDWQAELSQAIDIAGEHLSLYQLTIENGTAFGDRFAAGKLRGLPNEDLQADMYALTQELTGDAGLRAYETSNHARAGAESQHNLIYWRGGDWIGVGPGAHGRLTIDGIRFATEAPKPPTGWLERVKQDGRGESLRSALSAQDTAEEYLMMSLRLREGTRRDRLAKLGYTPNLQGVVDLGLMDVTDSHLRLTPAGRPLLNAVLREVMV